MFGEERKAPRRCSSGVGFGFRALNNVISIGVRANGNVPCLRQSRWKDVVDVVNKTLFTSSLFVNDRQSRHLIPFRDSFTGPDPVVCIACAPMTTAHGRCNWARRGTLRCCASAPELRVKKGPSSKGLPSFCKGDQSLHGSIFRMFHV